MCFFLFFFINIIICLFCSLENIHGHRVKNLSYFEDNLMTTCTSFNFLTFFINGGLKLLWRPASATGPFSCCRGKKAQSREVKDGKCSLSTFRLFVFQCALAQTLYPKCVLPTVKGRETLRPLQGNL